MQLWVQWPSFLGRLLYLNLFMAMCTHSAEDGDRNHDIVCLEICWWKLHLKHYQGNNHCWCSMIEWTKLALVKCWLVLEYGPMNYFWSCPHVALGDHPGCWCSSSWVPGCPFSWWRAHQTSQGRGHILCLGCTHKPRPKLDKSGGCCR